MTNAEHVAEEFENTPLSWRAVLKKHRNIEEGLRLDLKIAVDGYPDLAGVGVGELCRRLQGNRGKMRQIYDAAAAVYCHELYFSHTLPEDRYPSLPEGRTDELLCRSFGSSGNFFYLVRTLAGGTADPGFLWLYAKTSRRQYTLGLARLPLYSLPDLARFRPLFCIDLWEHAYIERFGRDISGYADSYLRLLDWESVFSKIP